MRETETAIIERIKTDVKWEEWKEQVNSQITSGLTVKEWCRQNKVNEKTYYYPNTYSMYGSMYNP